MKTKTLDIFDDFAFFEFSSFGIFSFVFSFLFLFVFRFFFIFFLVFLFFASSFFFQSSEQTPKPVKIVEQLIPFVKMTISFCENSILGSLDRRGLRKAHLRVGPLSCFSFLLFLFVHFCFFLKKFSFLNCNIFKCVHRQAHEDLRRVRRVFLRILRHFADSSSLN